jgi:hypothetical protein
MLFNTQQLTRGWQATKRIIGDSFHHAVRIGHGIDQTMRVGKKLLGSIRPLLDQYGGQEHVNTAMKALKVYDEGRSQIMDTMNNVQIHHARIQREVPEINL